MITFKYFGRRILFDIFFKIRTCWRPVVILLQIRIKNKKKTGERLREAKLGETRLGLASSVSSFTITSSNFFPLGTHDCQLNTKNVHTSSFSVRQRLSSFFVAANTLSLRCWMRLRLAMRVCYKIKMIRIILPILEFLHLIHLSIYYYFKN